MIFVVAVLVVIIAIQMVLLVQYRIIINEMRERLLKSVKANIALAQKVAESRNISKNAEKELEQIGKIYRERTMPVEMTEVKHD